MELKLRAFSRFDENGRPEEDMVTEVWTGFTDRNGVEVYEGDILNKKTARNPLSLDMGSRAAPGITGSQSSSKES